MLVRFTTLCLVGAFLIDWKGMPDNNLFYVVCIAMVLSVLDVVIEALFRR